MAFAFAVSPLRYAALSSATVTVIAAAGSIAGPDRTAGIHRTRPTTNARRTRRALPSLTFDMNPIPARGRSADRRASRLGYLIMSAECRTAGGWDVPGRLRAGRPLRVSLEPRVQSLGPRSPGGGVPAAALGLVEAGQLLVAGRERVRIVEAVDDLDGSEEMFLRLRPFAAPREHEAQVRPRLRQGHGVADRARQGEGPFRARGGFVDRLQAEEAVDGVRQRVGREADLARRQGHVGGSREGRGGLPRVPFLAHDDAQVDLNRGLVSRRPPDRRGRLQEAGLGPDDVAASDQDRAEVRQGADPFPRAAREHLRRPDEVADRRFKVPEFPLDAPEGPQGLAFDFRRVQARGVLGGRLQDSAGLLVRAEAVLDPAQMDAGPQPLHLAARSADPLEGGARLLEPAEERRGLCQDPFQPGRPRDAQ